MSILRVEKVVSALPETLEADAIYLVRVGSGFDLYATNHSGIVVAQKINGGSQLRRIEVDVGPDFVGDADFTILDASVNSASLIEARVLPLGPTDGRSVDEIFVERVGCFAVAGAGQFLLRLLPFEGNFSGRFVIGYTVT